MRDPMIWQLRGLCQEAKDGADWFARTNSDECRQAKRWCSVCPVRQQCLDFALTEPGVLGRGLEGVWGGTDATERAWLKDPTYDDIWLGWGEDAQGAG
jgi:WhiB family redox-sensing transcriptional regulator